MSHRRNVLFAAPAGAAVIVAAAFAAATPVTPSPGATVTTAHPRFSWTLPAGEQSQGIFIADRRDTSPEGRFYDQSIIQTGVLTPSARAWTASSPLYAGSYWWNVWSSDQDSFAIYSAPAAFTIPVALALRGVSTRRYSARHALDIAVRWTANVPRPLVRVRLLRGRRVVWKAGQRAYSSIGSVSSTSFTWNRQGRIRKGTRLRLLASISAGGVKRTRALVVRAP